MAQEKMAWPYRERITTYRENETPTRIEQDIREKAEFWQ